MPKSEGKGGKRRGWRGKRNRPLALFTSSISPVSSEEVSQRDVSKERKKDVLEGSFYS